MRQYLDLSPPAQAVCIALAFGIGLASGYVAPWGWGRPPPADAPEPPVRAAGVAPRPGVVLSVGPDSALIPSGAVHDPAAGGRLAIVLWLRGKRNGKSVVRVSGCSWRAGFIETFDPPAREPWRADGRGILDMVALAACHDVAPAVRPGV